jgi:sporulation protein YlmC with PRC-barrel domain
MLKTFNDVNQLNERSVRKRFTCMKAGQSSATELLRSCPVVTANGQAMGRVRSVLVDVRSRQLRYVIIAPNNSKASVVIPWQALYFDSERVRLVYYTFS